MHLIVRFFIVTLAILFVSRIVPGITLDSVYTACIVALVLGVLNVVVRPILILVTLPITLLTFGLFIFVLNALLLYFVGSIVDGFDVAGFVPALLGSLLISSVSWVAHKII